ncbi:MAG: hypothetical protein KA955_08285 [Prevotella sp.]|nr:hypothetical protein [Prevotella sp.]
MKRSVLFLCGAITLSGCGSYTANGAYAGSMIGSMLGSAIGGISSGPRGSDLGSIFGMAGGAVAGAAIGSIADKAEENAQCRQNGVSRDDATDDPSGFDPTNSADDRIYEYNDTTYSGNYSAVQPQTLSQSAIVSDVGNGASYGFKLNSTIEIRNARFVDMNPDGILRANEECKVIFEVINNSSDTLYDVQPTVIETTGNKHIFISPNIHVESILPYKGIRYTATVKADKKLKDGIAKFCVAVAQGNNQITSNVKEFLIKTKK